ncbi:MAG: PF20097 family protein [Syntrophomonadaceae bacterium]|jgi:hypothetical protein|nr:PF20097 family protein [Syntrophomonadaceae bacterium]
MTCPKCGGEMETGIIQGGQMLIWTPKKHKISMHPRNDGKDIVLDKNFLAGAAVEAFCCRKCDFIMIPVCKENNYE